jgi:hypothetical protein
MTPVLLEARYALPYHPRHSSGEPVPIDTLHPYLTIHNERDVQGHVTHSLGRLVHVPTEQDGPIACLADNSSAGGADVEERTWVLQIAVRKLMKVNPTGKILVAYVAAMLLERRTQ